MSNQDENKFCICCETGDYQFCVLATDVDEPNVKTAINVLQAHYADSRCIWKVEQAVIRKQHPELFEN